MNEGSVWEALLFCAHKQLDNFVLIIDANQYQAMGLCTEILNCEPLVEKLEAFGFDTWECDGHALTELSNIFTNALLMKNGKPKALVARTLKGKGISFMERDNSWHYSRLNDELHKKCLEELSI
jgi:transketolase